MQYKKLVSELRSVNKIRRDSTPLSTVVNLCNKAADVIESIENLVLRITTAYEQGVGHARRTELSNPYGEGTPEHEAWDIGREFGLRKPTIYQRIPTCGSEVADLYIEKSLKERDWPCNPKNACRAGWEAARSFIRDHEST